MKNKKNILIVDDSPTEIYKVFHDLESIYNISSVRSGKEAIAYAHKNQTDGILLDVIMPDIDGFETCRILKKDPLTTDIPIIFLSSMDQIKNKAKGFQLGAVDYITKPYDSKEILIRLDTHLTIKEARKLLKDKNKYLEEQLKIRMKEIQRIQDATIRSLASLAETRDNETGKHIFRTQLYVKKIGKELMRRGFFKEELTNNYLTNIYKSAPLHDIGKVGIEDSILFKPGKLTPDEREKMNTHALLGYNTLKRAEQELGQSSFLKYASEIALTHHEKYDGSGYPTGLSGNDIPLSGRIMAIADVYDALTSIRPYKNVISHSKALEIIKDSRGTHFDPIITDVFVSIENDILQIAFDNCDSLEQKLEIAG